MEESNNSTMSALSNFTPISSTILSSASSTRRQFQEVDNKTSSLFSDSSTRVELSTNARYDSYKIPSQLIGKSKYETFENWLAGWYQEYAYNRSDLDQSFIVVGETISNHLALSPLSFEGASLLRNHLMRVLFCHRDPTQKLGLESSNLITTTQEQDMDFVSRVDLLNKRAGTELQRLNEWMETIPEGERQGTRIEKNNRSVNHLLRIYVFLTYLRTRDTNLILNKAASKIKLFETAYKQLASGLPSEKKKAQKVLGPIAEYDKAEHSKWSRALAYIKNDIADANLLIYYLRNGSSEKLSETFRLMARDQLYKLDIWTEKWQQRMFSILLRYRYKESKQPKQLSLGLTKFNEQKGTLETEKLRFFGSQSETTWENSEWLRQWSWSAEDYQTFGFWSNLEKDNQPINKSPQSLQLFFRRLDASTRDLYDDLKRTRDKNWSAQYAGETEDVHENRISWDYLSIKETAAHEALFYPIERFSEFLEKLEIPFGKELGAPTRNGPTNIDQLQGEKWVIDAQVNELVDEILNLPETYKEVDGHMECDMVDPSENNGSNKIRVHLNYKQVVLMNWIYKDLYLSKNRKNTLSLDDEQYSYLNKTFNQIYHETPAVAQVELASLSKTLHVNHHDSAST